MKTNTNIMNLRLYTDIDVRRKPAYQDDPGEVSDTATDILLRGELVDKKPTHLKSWPRCRSVDSDSVSSLSDPSDEVTSSRQRSKSVDARGQWHGYHFFYSRADITVSRL